MLLVNKNHELLEKVSTFKPPAIKWLIQRYGKGASIQETHPIADSILTLEKYISKIPQIKARWQNRDKKVYGGKSWGEILAMSYINEKTNPTWKKPPYDWENINSWAQSPMDWINMSSDEMSQIMTLVDLKKAKNTVSEEGLPDIFIKKIGPWNIWLPRTQSDSIRIAGFDPTTMKSHVTWCTARTSGSNLFYSYNGVDKYLIYIIKDNPRPHPDPSGVWDYISIGVDSGVIQNPTGHGGSTVERDNNANTSNNVFHEKMKKATSPYYDQIMSVVEKIASEQRDSPSVEYQIKSLTDHTIITHILASLGFNEKLSEIRRLIKMGEDKNILISPEVCSTVINLLKIKEPDGSYDYNKFGSLTELLFIITKLDSGHFKSISNIKKLFEYSSNKNIYMYDYDIVNISQEDLLIKILNLEKSSHLNINTSFDILASIKKVYKIITGDFTIFGEEVSQFLLDKIKKQKRKYTHIAVLFDKLQAVKTADEAFLLYKKYSNIFTNVSGIDDGFIKHLNHDFLPINIIERNTTNYRLSKKIVELPDVVKSITLASESSKDTLNFFKNYPKISDIIITNSSNIKYLFVKRLIHSFEFMESKEVFSVLLKISDSFDEFFSQDIKMSIEKMKIEQNKKFREVLEKVSTMVFPHEIIKNIFDIKAQTLDNFIDDLLDNNLLNF